MKFPKRSLILCLIAAFALAVLALNVIEYCPADTNHDFDVDVTDVYIHDPPSTFLQVLASEVGKDEEHHHK